MKKLVFILFASLCFNCLTAQWTKLDVPSNTFFQSSYFIDDNTGLLLSTGYMFRTNDGGITWDSIGTNYQYSWFNTAHFTNEQVGFVGGGANFPFPPSSISDLILKTEDGGVTFDSVFGGLSGSEILSIDFLDENNGMFISSYYSFKTVDGGVTLDTLSFPNTTNTLSYGRDVAFPNLQNAYAISMSYQGQGNYHRSLHKSTDQGDNWNLLREDTIINTISGIEFHNKDYGYLFGSDGKIQRTNDGGATWDVQFLGDLFLTNMQISNEQVAFLTAMSNDTSYLYSTIDGGSSWGIELIDTGFSASSLSLTDNFLYASDYSQLYKRSITSFPTDIINRSMRFNVRVYPNPSSESFQIRIDKVTLGNYCQLFNMHGQKVMELAITNEAQIIDVQHLSSGSYSLVLTDGIKPLAFTNILIK